jgi:hypothetical protein
MKAVRKIMVRSSRLVRGFVTPGKALTAGARFRKLTGMPKRGRRRKNGANKSVLHASMRITMQDQAAP